MVFSSQNSSCRDSEQGRSRLISASPQGTWGLLLYICSQGWAPPCPGPGSADSHSQLFNRFGTSSSGLCPLCCSTSQVTPSLTGLMASLEPWLGQEYPSELVSKGRLLTAASEVQCSSWLSRDTPGYQGWQKVRAWPPLVPPQLQPRPGWDAGP